MAAAIDDELLDAFAVTASWDGLADALIARFGGLADRIFPYDAPRPVRPRGGRTLAGRGRRGLGRLARLDFRGGPRFRPRPGRRWSRWAALP